MAAPTRTRNDERPVVLLLPRATRDALMARRARELASRTVDALDVRISYRDAPESVDRPDVVYVFDAVPRELRDATRAKARGIPVVVEAGDVWSALRRALGRGALETAAAHVLESATWRLADALVLRGEGFRDVLSARGVRRRVDVLPDGVDLERFRPLPPEPERRGLGLERNDVAIGVVGSIVWSARQKTTYGWELIEALPSTTQNVKAVIVGDGSGVERLRLRARELDVASRVLFTGAVPHERIPRVLAALDAVTWTQTPDDVGRCRTTLKLPEYLACGKFVIASAVGEALRCVRANGVTVPYRGGRDAHYVAGVARAMDYVAADPAHARAVGAEGIRVARRFDWDRVAAGFVGVVERTLARRR